MRRRLLVTIILATALVRIEPGEAVRPTRSACKQACDAKITQDCLGLPRGRYRACRRGIVRACRRSSVDACFMTPTVTTTSLGSGTSLHVTSTTTASTSTTLFSYNGQWHFSGTLRTDSCNVGAPQQFGASVSIVHTAGAPVVSLTINGSFSLVGSASPAGFEAREMHTVDFGCTVATGIGADGTSDPDHMIATIDSSAVCPTDECRLAWTGDLVR